MKTLTRLVQYTCLWNEFCLFEKGLQRHKLLKCIIIIQPICVSLLSTGHLSQRGARAVVPTRAQCGLGTSHALYCFADVCIGYHGLLQQ